MIKNFKKNSRRRIAIPICILVAVGIVGITNSPIKAETLKNGSALLQTNQSDINYVNIVKKFLPSNAQIVTPSNTNGKTTEEDNILLKDLDNDGENEIITAYKSSGQLEDQMNILVLKKVGENWVKALDEAGVGFKLDLALTEDIDEDGQNEVLLSRRVGGTDGELSIYKWNNNLLNKVSNEYLSYSKLDIVDVAGKNIKTVATWTHDLGDTYVVDIWKWDGKKFILAKDLYPNYFKQSVIPYYQQKIKDGYGGTIYWYLADAQINAGDKNAALDSIKKWCYLVGDQVKQEDKNAALNSIEKGLRLGFYLSLGNDR